MRILWFAIAKAGVPVWEMTLLTGVVFVNFDLSTILGGFILGISRCVAGFEYWLGLFYNTADVLLVRGDGIVHNIWIGRLYGIGLQITLNLIHK